MNDYTTRVEVGPAFRRWWEKHGRPTSWGDIAAISVTAALGAWTADAPDDWQDVMRTEMQFHGEEYRAILFRDPCDFGRELITVAAIHYRREISVACRQLSAKQYMESS